MNSTKFAGAALSCSIALLASPVHAERIKLSTGEVLVVKVLETTDKTIRIAHPVLGEMTLPRDSVTILPEPVPEELKPPAAEAANTGAVQAAAPVTAAPAEAAKPPEFPPPPPPKEWKFKLVASAGLTEGNSENSNFNVIFAATRETKETKLALDTQYFFAQSDGDRSTNRFSTGGRHDWLNPGSQWFQFVDGRFDWDEFQSWDERVNAHVGLGYRIFEPPKFKLNALGGIGAVKEFGSDNEDVRPEALVGLEGQYDFAEKHSLAFSSIVYPDLLEFGEYRWVNNIAYSVLLDQATNLSLTAGLQHEYQSAVDPGREHDDLRLFAGLQLEF